MVRCGCYSGIDNCADHPSDVLGVSLLLRLHEQVTETDNIADGGILVATSPCLHSPSLWLSMRPF